MGEVKWYVPPNAPELTTTKAFQKDVPFAVVQRAAIRREESKVMEGVFISDQIRSRDGWYIEALIRTKQYAQLYSTRLRLGLIGLPMTECLNLSDAGFVERYRVIRLQFPPH